MRSKKKEVQLPPVIEILNSEKVFEISSIKELKTKLKQTGLLKELRNQATWTADNFKYEDSQKPTPGQFLISPSAPMNPFSSIGNCQEEECRTIFTKNFIKAVGLYADYSFLPDPLTP